MNHLLLEYQKKLKITIKQKVLKMNNINYLLI